MTRRMDTSLVGDLGEAEAVRLLTERGWAVTNLNLERRNHKLHDLRATKNGVTVMISIKHARAKRHVRLGNPNVFRTLRDEDFVIIFLPKPGSQETNIEAGDYDVWIVPGTARHVPLEAHLHYYGMDETVAFSQSNMMIKDKIDTPGGRSRSGAAFHQWQAKFRQAWSLLPA